MSTNNSYTWKLGPGFETPHVMRHVSWRLSCWRLRSRLGFSWRSRRGRVGWLGHLWPPQRVRLQGLPSVIATAPLLPVRLGLLGGRLRRGAVEAALWGGSGTAGGWAPADASALPGWHRLTFLELLDSPHLSSGQVGLGAHGFALKVHLRVLMSSKGNSGKEMMLPRTIYNFSSNRVNNFAYKASTTPSST